MRTPNPTPDSAVASPGGSVLREILELERMTLAELQAKHHELFGVETKSRSKRQLFKKLAARVQELHRLDAAEDHQSTEADERKAERSPHRPRVVSKTPPVGALLEREYDGEIHRVRILADGVEYEGRRFRSLSGVAREITGTNWNGKRFFGLIDRKGAAR